MEQALARASKNTLDEVAQEVQQEMRNEVPARTRALRRSIVIEHTRRNVAKVGVDAERLRNDPDNVARFDYSKPYAFGHDGYTIRPVNAKVLRWFDEAGNPVFRAYANIPPSPGHNFPAIVAKRFRTRRR